MNAAQHAEWAQETGAYSEHITGTPVPRPTSLIKLPHLHAWRLKRERTQLDVAAVAGVSISTIVRAEKGSDVGALTATKLARALGVTVKQLQEEAPPETSGPG